MCLTGKVVVRFRQNPNSAKVGLVLKMQTQNGKRILSEKSSGNRGQNTGKSGGGSDLIGHRAW